jgi:hypothetical protein
VRRAKLFYLRGRSGKAARIKERRVDREKMLAEVGIEPEPVSAEEELAQEEPEAAQTQAELTQKEPEAAQAQAEPAQKEPETTKAQEPEKKPE